MRKLLPVLLALSGLAAMAQSYHYTNSVTPPTDKLPSLTTTALYSIANLSGYVPDDKYKLRPGDKVSLQILEDRDAPKSLTVTDSSELEVPYIGRVTVKDKTSKDVAEELKAKLEKEFYHRATVVIALDIANKLLGRVYVVGQVRSQGAIEMQMNENLTVGKAIMRSGGMGDFANKTKVKIVRAVKTASGTTNQVIQVNMKEILEDGKLDKDVPLEPDDFIIVPSRLINF